MQQPLRNNTLSYRRGSIDDLQQLKELGIISYGKYATVLSPDNWELMSANLHNEDRTRQLINTSTVFVCTDGDRIVGMTYLIPKGMGATTYPTDWCYIRMVGVHPDYQGNGICKILMKQCIETARANGESVMGLHTSEIMNDARHIYEQLGFSIVKDLDMLFGIRYWLYRLDL